MDKIKKYQRSFSFEQETVAHLKKWAKVSSYFFLKTFKDT